MLKNKICKCGCGRAIIIKPYHRIYSIPEYIQGHHVKGKNNPMKRPEVRKKHKEALNKPGVKEKHKKIMKEIANRPEILEASRRRMIGDKSQKLIKQAIINSLR